VGDSRTLTDEFGAGLRGTPAAFLGPLFFFA